MAYIQQREEYATSLRERDIPIPESEDEIYRMLDERSKMEHKNLFLLPTTFLPSSS